jgi:hypothetical protein
MQAHHDVALLGRGVHGSPQRGRGPALRVVHGPADDGLGQFERVRQHRLLQLVQGGHQLGLQVGDRPAQRVDGLGQGGRATLVVRLLHGPGPLGGRLGRERRGPLALRPALGVSGGPGVLLGPLDRLAVLGYAAAQVHAEAGRGGRLGDAAPQHRPVVSR